MGVSMFVSMLMLMFMVMTFFLFFPGVHVRVYVRDHGLTFRLLDVHDHENDHLCKLHAHDDVHGRGLPFPLLRVRDHHVRDRRYISHVRGNGRADHPLLTEGFWFGLP
mmetsp:Transcript_18585/g.28705  ORF Transcript_18585/g.28705 Transcript_18585/m.28705 type:complete len:108 (+) Transcript_18585:343-666(+)